MNKDFRLKAALQHSDYRQTRYSHFTSEDWSKKSLELDIGKEEQFSVQVILNSLNGEVLYSANRDNLISWKGLVKRIRLDIEAEEDLDDAFKISFLKYVKNDLNLEVAEPISTESSVESKDGITQSAILEGKVPQGFNRSQAELKINIYIQEDFQEEEKLESLNIKLNVHDFVFEEPRTSDAFFLDLWQHPSNWARQYEVELWSEDHFAIIENMLEELASMGNKVITVIASDFPWAGQLCNKNYENPSNLFEYNMIKVERGLSGELEFNYDHMDRYVETAIRLGIDKEIDIFGISGVWYGEMGSPIEDSEEPIKIGCYDKKERKISYIKSREELGHYIKALVDHMEEKGWLEKTRLISDHPKEDKVFKERRQLVEGFIKPLKVKHKSAIFKKEILKSHSDKLDDISICSAALVGMGEEIDPVRDNLRDKDGKFTWYVCWFPERPNNFIETPLLDNRLIGWFTYLFGMDGFLRWDYAIWPKDPLNETRYNYPYWKAGDMFFVYPGKNMKPLRSLRWENLRYGIQDYQMFNKLEEIGYNREEILDEFIHPVLGKAYNYKANHDRSVKIKFNEDLSKYLEIRKKILGILERKI